MAEADIPFWLKNLPLAPVYRPTETEFADPIGFISRIEREAAAFGICKVIPPLPKPSKKFVLHNLNRSLSKSPELGDTRAASASSSESAVFTTRQQELGSRRARPAIPKQVWQSGDVYTLEQFESKAKAFSRTQLGGFKEVTPLLVESLFWKAVAEKPIYIEYANDVPGSGFAVPEESLRYISRWRSRKRELLRGHVKEQRCGIRIINSSNDGQPQKSLDSGSNREGWEGTSGWKLSNSRWNLQVIARSPGSLTRFMPDEVPGVTSPMVYIGMLFSWFAWHVEDHELHSMNFLHMGSPKTWYAVPGDYADTMEEIVRVKGYGGNVDRLQAFTMLGEKTTLLSPEVLAESGVPCCRLVQHPGEFVVTFPRAYHVGFSHGFNCGEAANFATPQWLKVAKEAAIRRAAMNHLPMLSHQQLLYILTMSFVSRVPRTLISGARSSRMRDRKKEEREILVKKAFLTDLLKENNLLCILLAKESSSSPVLWEPEMLPAPSAVSQPYPSVLNRVHDSGDQHVCYEQQKEIDSEEISSHKVDDCCIEKPVKEAIALLSTSWHDTSFVVPHKNAIHLDFMTSDAEVLKVVEDEGDLPVGLNVDSGSLACVACGILGFPFMAILQPSEEASRVIFPITYEATHEKSDKSECLFPPCLQNDASNSDPVERSTKVSEQAGHPTCEVSPASSSSSQHSSEHEIVQCGNNIPLLSYFPIDSVENKGVVLDATDSQILSSESVSHIDSKAFYFNGQCLCDRVKEFVGSGKTAENDFRSSATEPFSVSGEELVSSVKEKRDEAELGMSNVLLRPRVFCLQHAIEVEELLHSKGGGHVRVICHSDYLKIKAYAASIAEEIGSDLDFKDVPLENASQDDLNLINISIDEEEYQEDGKDWTSRLGVNLRYCVKLRKHSPSSQEQLPSALSQIFSACSPVSIVSGLRWLCRRSRTPAKPVGNIVERAYVSTNVEEDVRTLKKNDTSSSKAIQVYRSRKNKPSDLAFKDQFPPLKELGNCKQNARVIYRSEHTASASENVGNLFNVPLFILGSHKETQNSIEMYKFGTMISNINTADLNGTHSPVDPAVESCEVGDSILSRVDDAMIVPVPVRYHYGQVYHNIRASNCSAMFKEEKSVGASNIGFDEGNYKCLDTPVEMAISESKTFEVKQLTEAVTEDCSEHKLVDPCRKDPLLLTAGEDDHIQETPAEKRNTEGSPRFALLAEDHADVPRLFSDDSEMYIGVPVTEKISRADCSVLGEGLQCNVSSEDEVQKIGIPAVREIVLAGEVSEILLTQLHLTGKSTAVNSKTLQEACSTKVTDSVPVIKVDVLQKLANNAADTKMITGHVVNGYCPEDTAEMNEKKSSDLDIILYVRRRNKRNRGEGAQEFLETENAVKAQKKTEAHKEDQTQHSSNGFVRSPCEGLRPRRRIPAQTGNTILGRISATKATQRAHNLVGQRRKSKVRGTFHCDIDGCQMRFRTREELQLHKHNRCTYEECGKRFSNHKYAMRHQRVHSDDRFLKCPWKGCNMSFKWEWARTEHLRLHTGEKPYRCKVAGCGLSFRFISDFSRHRRKTGHFVSNITQ